MAERLAALACAFERIAQTRMAGLPFVNPRLRVEAVGPRDWEGHRLAVLVTPWSINAVLVPGAGPWPSLPRGAERFVDLPGGRFRFIAAADEEAGEYHACSLFSPALEFADHDAAREAAAAALAALLGDAAFSEPARAARGVSRRDFLRARAGGGDVPRG